MRTNNGTEFINSELTDFLQNLGIIHQTSCPYTPQHNGVVERKQHLLNVARALKFQSNVPIFLWGDCVLTVTHLINILPYPHNQNMSPYEILFQKKPSYSYLRNFGCLCYISNFHNDGDKIATKAIKRVFSGYPFNKKGYKVVDLSTKKCYVTRDIVFKEHIYPFQDSSVKNSNTSMFTSSDSSLNPDDIPQTTLIPTPSITSSDSPSVSNNSKFVPAQRPVRQRKLSVRLKDYTGIPAHLVSNSVQSDKPVIGT